MAREYERIVDGPPVIIIMVRDLLIRRILKRYCLRLDFSVLTFVNPATSELTNSLTSKNIQYIISDLSFPLDTLGFHPDLEDKPPLITLRPRTQKRQQYIRNSDNFLEIPFTLADLKKVLLG